MTDDLDQPGVPVPMHSSQGRLTGTMKEDLILNALRNSFFVEGATSMEIAAEIPAMSLGTICRVLRALQQAEPSMVVGTWHGDPEGTVNTLHFKIWQLTAQGKERVDANG